MDAPDIGASAEAWGRDRYKVESMKHVMWSTTPEAACRSLLTDPVTNWGTVTRGVPPGHLLSDAARAVAGLTAETWSLEVAADPYEEPPHVREATEIGQAVRLTLPELRALGARAGTVKVVKAMQCLNVDTPLGQGVWEGVPLATVLRECGTITACRRINYWGWHNDDPEQVFRSSVSYTEAFEPVPGEPPVFLAFSLNGKPIPPVSLRRGRPQKQPQCVRVTTWM
jgi:hypothetical protein